MGRHYGETPTHRGPKHGLPLHKLRSLRSGSRAGSAEVHSREMSLTGPMGPSTNRGFEITLPVLPPRGKEPISATLNWVDWVAQIEEGRSGKQKNVEGRSTSKNRCGRAVSLSSHRPTGQMRSVPGDQQAVRKSDCASLIAIESGRVCRTAVKMSKRERESVLVGRRSACGPPVDPRDVSSDAKLPGWFRAFPHLIFLHRPCFTDSCASPSLTVQRSSCVYYSPTPSTAAVDPLPKQPKPISTSAPSTAHARRTITPPNSTRHRSPSATLASRSNGAHEITQTQS